MHKRNAGEMTFLIISAVFLSLFSFLCIYPFYYVIIASLMSGAQNVVSYFWPKQFSINTYLKIFENPDIGRAFFISASRTFLGTVLSVFFSAMFAYLITQENMLFRKFVYRFSIITMYFSAGLIPWYLTMRMYGFYDNYLLYVIPSAVSVWFVILVKTYIESLPKSLEESALIDGAGFFTIYVRIIMPLCKPILATIAVFEAIGQWNSWSDNFFLVDNPKLQTLQLLLYRILNQAQQLADAMRNNSSMHNVRITFSANTVRMAMVVISVVPIMFVYPFLQRFFTKGIMMGAIKG